MSGRRAVRLLSREGRGATAGRILRGHHGAACGVSIMVRPTVRYFIAGVLVSTVVNLSCISTADSGGCSSCCRRCCCAARLQRRRSGGGVCCCLRRRGGVGDRSTRRNIMSKRGASCRYQELVPSWMWVRIRRSALMSISARSSRMRLHLAVTARPATLCGLPCGCLRIVRSACGR